MRYLTIASLFVASSLHGQVYEHVHRFDYFSVEKLDAYPAGELVLGDDGCLYGTTQGAIDDAGTVYKITTTGAVTNLIGFPSADEGSPETGSGSRAALAKGGDGNFYGTNAYGGIHNRGTIYRISPNGGFTKLVDFTGIGGIAKGSSPETELLAGADGYFYGTTTSGGASDLGVIFRMSPTGAMTTLVEFTGTSGTKKGDRPRGGLAQAPNGTLFGTTTLGGTQNLGTLFKVDPDGGNFQTLVEFTGTTGPHKGSSPEARLTMDTHGVLWGSTSRGGATDLGTIFNITQAGVLDTVVEFTGATGSHPGGDPDEALLLDGDGNFYGTSGSSVFKMKPDGTMLLNVELDPAIGYNPTSLTFGGDGFLYGVCRESESPWGSIFRFAPDGTVTFLVEADDSSGTAGIGEITSLVNGGDGSIYGTTSQGGNAARGSVFRLTGGGTQTNLLEFAGSTSRDKAKTRLGTGPTSLLRSSDGNFYGVTTRGGLSDAGTVFRMAPGGAHEVIHDFSENSAMDGRWPTNLVLGPGGVLFGTTSGSPDVVFKVTPTGDFTELFTFTGIEGSHPGSSPNRPFLASDGNFYGTTETGGIHNRGVVYRITPLGDYTLLHEFTPDFYTSTVDWQNVPITNQYFYNPFTITFKLTPDASNMNGVTGLSATAASDYTHLACIVRLNPSGFFDVRKGGAYASDTAIGYSAGNTYSISMTISLQDRTYSVSVDGTPIASNYPFRTEQSFINSLSYLALRNESNTTPGTHTVSDISLQTNRRGPKGVLAQGTDGKLYGTIAGQGDSEKGRLFRITPSPQVQFEELGSFTGSVGGANPSDLYAQPDGTFVGIVGDGGGAYGNGCVFRATTSGALSNFVSIPAVVSGDPLPFLVGTDDGLIYGATLSNSIFRVVTQGPPIIHEPDSIPEFAVGSLSLYGKFTARSPVASVVVDYGPSATPIPSGGPFPQSKSLGTVNGFFASSLGTTLDNLLPGKTYYWQFRVTNGTQTTLGPVRSFVTTGRPQATLLEATNVGPASATLNGEVNASNAATVVYFDYKKTPDLDNSPETISVEVVDGSTDEPVNANLLGLDGGTTYYYRIRATNPLGTVTAGTGSFTTIAAPVPNIDSATALSTTKAKLFGSVNPKGSSADVYFEYRVKPADENVPWTNFERPRATPSTVTGNEPVTVSKELTGLIPGTTYEYRVYADGPAGKVSSTTGTFTLSILSGLLRDIADPAPDASNSLTVNFVPAGLGAWRFRHEPGWRASGETATHLTGGERDIEFLPVPGFTRPPDETIGLFDGGGLTLQRSYTATGGGGQGDIIVHLKPDSLASTEVPETSRAQWRFVGETTWRNTATLPVPAAAGTPRIECKPLAGSGYVAPPIATIAMGSDDHLEVTLTYVQPFTGMTPVTFADITSDEDPRYANLGQIRNWAATGTGFAARRRVVVTAAHMVFDDRIMAFIPEVEWLHQRHAGEHDPVPQLPRGYLVLEGYADQREADPSAPGDSNSDTRNLDAAVLYFQQDAARGGYGGFLASEGGDANEFLTSDAEKFLAGYPVDRVPAANQGKLHASSIFTGDLEQAPGEIWTTPHVIGADGCSGGPLFVKHRISDQEEVFFPAAIYLGGGGDSVFRAIDRELADLILQAEQRSTGGGNSGNYGLTQTTIANLSNSSAPSTITVVIEPEAARNSLKAGWKLTYPDERVSGKIGSGIPIGNLPAGSYLIQMLTIPEFRTPDPLPTIQVTSGTSRTYTYTYAPKSLATIEDWRQAHFNSRENQGVGADSADPDHDGRPNIDEYAASTNPNINSDFFRALSCSRGPTTFTVTVFGKQNRRYTLERRNPSTGDWSAVLPATSPLASDNPALQLIDPSPPSGIGLYRVVASP
jgi:uncharacterized repeat protein (TIGR03803 family)